MPSITTSLRDEFDRAKREWIRGAMDLATAEVSEGLDEGRYGLKSRLGTLRSSVQPNILAAGDGYKVGTRKEYGYAWEYGFDRPKIVPVNVKALHFFYRGREVFCRSVRAMKFPARPWLLPALESTLDEQKDLAEEIFSDALKIAFPDQKIEISDTSTR